jgi:hypothetical protein
MIINKTPEAKKLMVHHQSACKPRKFPPIDKSEKK